MKSSIRIKILWFMILSLFCISNAFGETDYSGMSFDELMKEQERLTAALWASDEWQNVTVPSGVYKIGEDIPAGRWSISAAKGTSYLYVGQNLADNGNELAAPFKWEFVSNKNEKYSPSVTWELLEGSYFVIANNPAVFTTATSGSLGFGKKKDTESTNTESNDKKTKELEEQNEKLSKENTALQTQNTELAKQVTDLTAKIKQLESNAVENSETKTEKTEASIVETEPVASDDSTQGVEPFVEKLAKGSKGEEVKKLNQRLIDLKYLKGKAEKNYTNTTINAVKQFQISAGITLTGEVNEETWNALFAQDAPGPLTYEKFDYKKLARNSDDCIGKYYKFDGTVSWESENANNSNGAVYVAMGVNTRGRYSDAVYIAYARKEGEQRYIEKDKVTIYGEYIGLYSYKSVSAGTVTLPRFELRGIELKNK